MRIYDITRPVSAKLACWPGDTAYQFSLAWSIDRGQSVNVGSIIMSTHTGTHTDAPYHFQAEGSDIGSLDLAPYIGLANVLEVSGKAVIEVNDFYGCDFERAPRLLLRTGVWKDSTRFPEIIPVLTSDAIQFLAEQNVVLLGMDLPSVDLLESTTLPNHYALARANITIIESLWLEGVPTGIYELIALPLRLDGADGSPVRAILRSAD